MATKKITLKHQQPNGAIETRTTARAYTCVLLRKHDNTAALAAHEARLPERVAEVTAYAKHWFKRSTLVLASKVGDPIPYDQNQGGYKRYADGTLATYPMYEFEPEHARKAFEEHGENEAAWVVSHVQEAIIEHQQNAKRISARSEEWEVISWHGNARNAKPAYICAGDQFRVEEINNGVRA